MQSDPIASQGRDTLRQALVALDLAGNPTFASPQAQALIAPATLTGLRGAIQQAVEQIREHPERIVHWRHAGPQGEIDCRLLAACDEEGRLRGYMLSAAPTVAGESPRDTLVQGRWEEAVDHVEDGLWDWDIESGRIRRSPRWLQMLGYAPGDLGHRVEDMLALLHPDDLAGLRAQVKRLTDGGVDHFTSEHRLRHRDGTWRWILDRGRVVSWRPDGAPRRIVGTQTDITAYKVLQARLGESELLLREAQRVAQIGSWAWEADTGKVWWSEEMFRIAGLPPTRAAPSFEQQRPLFPPGGHERLREALLLLLKEGTPCLLEFDGRRADGEPCRLVLRADRVCYASGRVARLVGVVQDVTEQRRASEAMRWQAELLNRISAMGRIGGFELHLDTREVHLTDEACRIHGLPSGEVFALERIRALYDADAQAAIDAACGGDRDGADIGIEGALTTPDGRRVWVESSGKLEFRDGRPYRITGLIRDVTEQREADERIERLAHFDSLTGLPTRAAFRQRALEAISQGGDSAVALLFIDLDRFKLVNEAMGHAAGDELLRQAAARLRGCVYGSDVLGRHGGDEFLLLLRDIRQPDDAAKVARRIIDEFARPMVVGGTELRIGCSIGIALQDQREQDPDELVRAADAAMSAAKDAGRGSFQFHDVAQFERAQHRLRIERALRGALERGEMSLAYQPAVCLDSGEIRGIEALLRWQPGSGESCGPDEFIPIAEATGEIMRLGDWALAEACRQARAWHEAGLRFEYIAVNASAVQLRDPGFASRAIMLCEAAGWPPERLALEITESSMMIDSEALRGGLALLESRGVRLAVDDFGTGFSNLQYLHRFPVSHLKIDRAFTWAMVNDPAAAELTQAIVTLGHALGLKVIGEGVETAQMAALLRGQGCDEAQGYLYARPLAGDALAAWLASRA